MKLFMSTEKANKIYDILIDCGASADEDDRDSFVRYVTGKSPIEWRFMGHLGFGGKFHPQDMRIGMYCEDETRERAAIVKLANRLLKQLGEK